MEFKEILKLNLNEFVEEKKSGGATLRYLSWASAWAEVKKLDNEANYTIHENAEGHAFFASQFGIDVKVTVKFKGVEHTMRLPVLDGANNAMKSEAYTYTVKKYKYVDNKRIEDGVEEKQVEAADAFDINKAIMRCLVKATAMHGFGLYIYIGDESPKQDKIVKKITQNQLDDIAQYYQVLITEFNHEVVALKNEDPTTWTFAKGESCIKALQELIKNKQAKREKDASEKTSVAASAV